MNYYQLIRVETRYEAVQYGEALPCDYKIVPVSFDGKTMYAVDVPRSYTGGRLQSPNESIRFTQGFNSGALNNMSVPIE